jgi:putative ABC transport system ATP-binding protein
MPYRSASTAHLGAPSPGAPSPAPAAGAGRLGPAPGPARAAARALGAVKQHGDGATAVRALDGVDLALPAGRLTAIVGPSGSGKSTLLHCLAGLDRLTSGSVFLGEVDLGSLSDTKLTVLRRERVGFVFQSFNLVPTLDARENILLPLRLAGRSAEPGWFDVVVDAVGVRPRRAHGPSELSGGQQQRVAVARALVSRPEVIFADEPTGNLDSQASREILRLLREAVVELDQTVVMVTHDPVAAEQADVVVRFADGRVVEVAEAAA